MPKRSKQLVKLDKFEVNEIVFAKVRGYKPWPSQVIEVYRDGQKYRVKFFGYEGGE